MWVIGWRTVSGVRRSPDRESLEAAPPSLRIDRRQTQTRHRRGGTPGTSNTIVIKSDAKRTTNACFDSDCPMKDRITFYI